MPWYLQWLVSAFGAFSRNAPPSDAVQSVEQGPLAPFADAVTEAVMGAITPKNRNTSNAPIIYAAAAATPVLIILGYNARQAMRGDPAVSVNVSGNNSSPTGADTQTICKLSSLEGKIGDLVHRTRDLEKSQRQVDICEENTKRDLKELSKRVEELEGKTKCDVEKLRQQVGDLEQKLERQNEKITKLKNRCSVLQDEYKKRNPFVKKKKRLEQYRKVGSEELGYEEDVQETSITDGKRSDVTQGVSVNFFTHQFSQDHNSRIEMQAPSSFAEEGSQGARLGNLFPDQNPYLERKKAVPSQAPGCGRYIE